jgi:hypothetical protein
MLRIDALQLNRGPMTTETPTPTELRAVSLVIYIFRKV